jgi:hypothetical protein
MAMDAEHRSLLKTIRDSAQATLQEPSDRVQLNLVSRRLVVEPMVRTSAALRCARHRGLCVG